MVMGPRTHAYEINAMLQVSEESVQQVQDFFSQNYGLKSNRIQTNMHLTVYHARRKLPGLHEASDPVKIIADVRETRFMVLAPGGENPRDELDPRKHSIGIRLTRRNSAIPEIQKLRQHFLRLEAKEPFGTRKHSTSWTNSFGSRNYQPHVQLLRPWHRLDEQLSLVGVHFREQIRDIEFDSLVIEERHRIDGQWFAGSLIP